MPRQYPKTPLPGVLAAVVRGDRILMVQRARDPDRGKWGFPGGLVEVGEATLDAAARELAEETGLVAEPLRVIDVFDVIAPDADGRIRYHFILNVVLCHCPQGEPAAADDAAAAGWFNLDEITAGGLECSTNVGRLARMLLFPGSSGVRA